MKKSLAFSVLSVALVLAASGCKKAPTVEGKWKFKESASLSKLTGAQAEMAKSFIKSMALEFKKDKKYSMSGMVPMEGDWTLDDHTVTMKVTTIAGMSKDQAMQMAMKASPAQAKLLKSQQDKPTIATLSEDGKTLTLNDTTGKGSVVFERDGE
ncbi:hypothetical protein [Fimbriimonas ginsengisoli]|uniref:hypothetical protein n=1 Tax=Fimbriimonas ginsengisoli TaxID=1005039 RepID=UPI0011861EEB|nr:hypothetical protein [Fimbriimonas ginsengisoli]